MFSHIWIFGHAETVHRHISRFQLWQFEQSTFVKNVENADSKCTFVTGFRSPSPVRLCPSCLRRFGDLRKNTPWNFGACILWMLSIFVDFRVPQVVPDRMMPTVATSQQPPCHTATGKQTRTGIKYTVRRIPPSL